MATWLTRALPMTYMPRARCPRRCGAASPARISVACPTASPDAHPLQPVTVFLTKQPRDGIYTTHNTGTFSLGGALNVSGKYPSRLFFEIRKVAKTTKNDTINGSTDITS